MLQQASHNTHGNHSHNHNHPNHHHPHLVSPTYHQNSNNTNLIHSSDGGMFNDREVHSMLESAVKGMSKSCSLEAFVLKITLLLIKTYLYDIFYSSL